MNIWRVLMVGACAIAAVAGAAAQGIEPQVIIQQPVAPYIGGAPIGNANPAPVTCISGCASPVVAASGGSAVLAVGAASANVALPASVTSFPTLLLVNNGTVDLFYNVGIGAGTAATTSPSATNLKLAAGRAIQFAPATSVTFVAAILASGSTATELDVYQLTAPSLIAGGGGSGGGGTGGSVTQGTSPWVVSVPTWAGGTLGAMANYGTSPGAVLVPGFNGFITGSTPEGAVGDAAWVSGNGSLIAIAKTIAGNTGAAIPLGTAGGWTPLKLAALSNTAVAIKGTAGWLGKLYCYNPNATSAYVQVYNVAQGSVTVGTTAALQSYGIPATSSSGFSTGPVGDQYSTAISIAATTAAGDGTAPATALDCNVSFN